MRLPKDNSELSTKDEVRWHPTPIGKCRPSCPICAASASSRSTPRRTTRGCAPIAARPGRGAAAISAASASPIAPTATFARIYFPLRHPDSDNFDREQVFRWLKDLIASDVRIRHPERSLRLGLAAHRCRHQDAAVRAARRDRRARDPVDENRFSYSLDALCAWRGLPGKDETLAEGGGQGRRLQGQQEEPAAIAHLAIAGAPCRTLRRGRRGEHARAIREPRPRSSIRRARAPPIGSRSICCRWCTRCAAAASASIRAPPNRRATYCLQKRDAALAELSEKLGARVGMEEIGRNKWLAQTFDAHGITYPRTEKGNPSFTAGNTGWMAQASTLAAAADREGRQVRTTPATNFSKAYILGHAGERAHSRRDQSAPLGRRRHPLVALFVFQSTAAADDRRTTRSWRR